MRHRRGKRAAKRKGLVPVTTERQQIVGEVLAGVKELLAERCLPQLVDAATLAHALNVNAQTVYRNADKLGGIKIGRNLRFDPMVAMERARVEEAPAPKPSRGRRPVESDASLPPIS
jgi:hypothetical protein